MHPKSKNLLRDLQMKGAGWKEGMCYEVMLRLSEILAVVTLETEDFYKAINKYA